MTLITTRQMTALLRKEWRDQRAVLLVAVALLLGFSVLLEFLGGLRANAELRCEVIQPILLLIFSAFLTAEVVASDAQSGSDRTLTSLAVPPVSGWLAKVTFVTLGIVGFHFLLLAIEWFIQRFEAPSALRVQQTLLLWPLVALQTAVVAPLAALLKRPLIAVLTGTIGSLLVGIACRHGIENLPPSYWAMTLELTLGAWHPVVLLAGAILIGLTISAYLYTQRLRGHSQVRVVLRSTLLLTVCVLPAGLPSIAHHQTIQAFDWNDADIRVGSVHPSPTGRFLAVLFAKPMPHSWIQPLRKNSANLVETRVYDMEKQTWLPSVHSLCQPYFSMGSNGMVGPWTPDNLLYLHSPKLLKFYDPLVDSVAWSEAHSVAANQHADSALGLERWYRKRSIGNGRYSVEWKATGNSIELPNNAFAASRKPATIYFAHDGQVRTHDFKSNKTRSLATCSGETFSPQLSPDGRYLCVRYIDCRVSLLEIATGRVVFEGEQHGFNFWSDAPGSILQTYGAKPAVVKEDGSLVYVPEDAKNYIRAREFGGHGWVTYGENKLQLLEPGGQLKKTLFDPEN